MANRTDASAQLVARLDRLPFSPWHRSFLLVAFFGTLFDALTYFIAAIAIWRVGIETKGLPLEKITGLDVGTGSQPA